MKNNTANKIKVLIVDDQQIIIEGLTSLLKDTDEIVIVGGCNDTALLLEKTEELKPDVMLMDFNMPGKDGLECIKEILGHYPQMKILMLTGYDDIALIRESLKLGATGYVLKNVGKEDLMRAIKTVANGQRFLDESVQDKIIQFFTESNNDNAGSEVTTETNNILSRRENEVLKLIAEGKKSIEIAKVLFISINTVDTHRKNILAKCDVKNTAELISFATKNGLI